jgi:WD40 repeat protein
MPCQPTEVTFSRSGKYVAVRCKDDAARVLEIPSGKQVADFSNVDRFSIFDFSRDGRWLTAGSRTGDVMVIALSDPSSHKRWHAETSGIELLKFVSENSLVAGTTGAAAKVWDFASTPVSKVTLSTDFSSLTAVAASPDGKYLVTTGADTVVRFYDAVNWKLISEHREYTLEPFAVDFTSDGKYAIVGGADRQLTCFDPSNGRVVRTLPVQSDPIQIIDAVDENRLAVLYIDADGQKPPHLQLWDLKSGGNRALPMQPSVIGGGVMNGRIWFAKASPNSVELVFGD